MLPALMDKIQVILVEDQQLLRAGVKYHLSRSGDIDVVAEAESLEQARSQVTQYKPDVVVLDIMLSAESGLDLLPYIQEESPESRVLVLTGHNSIDWIQKCISSGCAGFLDKAAIADEVASAVRSIHSGRNVVSVANLQGIHRQEPPHDTINSNSSGPHLSQRELEVLRCIARGKTNQQTANELFLSVKTIETYRSRLAKKIGCSHRSGFFEYATENGLIDGPSEE